MSQIALTFPHIPSYATEDYIVSACNRAAYDAMIRWPNWQDKLMGVVGPVASGKTHLAHIWAKAAGASFIPPEQLGTQDSSFWYGGSECAVLDGIAATASHEALFHLINYARAHQKFLLLTHTDPLSLFPSTLADLRSRLSAIPSVLLDLPDDAVLAAVLAKAFSDRQVKVNMEVIQYIINNSERSFDAIQRIASLIDTEAMSRKRAITLPFVREILTNPC